MNRAIEEWVRERVEASRQNDRDLHCYPPRPRFTSAPVAAAYRRMEDHALGRIRSGEGVWPGFPAQLRRFVPAWSVIDAAWEEPDGFVYMIGAQDPDKAKSLDHVKIGYSSDPATRLRQLQTGCHVKLEVEFSVPSTVRMERSLHEYLATDRAHGEWFARTDAVYEAMLCLHLVGTEFAWLRAGGVR